MMHEDRKRASAMKEPTVGEYSREIKTPVQRQAELGNF